MYEIRIRNYDYTTQTFRTEDLKDAKKICRECLKLCAKVELISLKRPIPCKLKIK